MKEEEIVEGIKSKLNAALKDAASLNRKKACDLICDAVHAITLLQLCLKQIRKETAKEILQELFDEKEFIQDAGSYPVVEAVYIIKLAEKYGVEVDG